VREAIGQRLNRLSEQCNQVLATASVIGREFDFKLLSILGAGITEERLLEVIDEALQAHLIEEVPGEIDHYQFSHALVQQTLAEELSTSRRARLHARIGEALETLYGANAEVHAAELAYHFAEASPATGPEKLAHYSSLAGERALSAYAWEDALAHFQRGLAAKEGQPTDAETASLLFGLGRAQAATLDRHQMTEAAASLKCAFDYYAQTGDVARAVAVAEYPIRTPPGEFGGADLIARALTLVPPDSHAAGRLLPRHGRALGLQENDYEGAREAFDRSLAIARRERDIALEMQTLAYAAHVSLHHLHFEASLEQGLMAVELARRTDDVHAELSARHWGATYPLMYLGDGEGARQQAEAMLALAEKLRDRYWLNNSLFVNQLVRHLSGDWSAARAFSDRSMAVSSTYQNALGLRALSEYEAGEFDQGKFYLERFLKVLRLIPPGPHTSYSFAAVVLALVTRITGADDWLDAAAAAAVAVVSSPLATPLVTPQARGGLALLAVHRGDPANAAEQYTALNSARGTMLGGASLVAVDRLLGLLSTTMGKVGQAIAHFEDALAFCRKAGYHPELAWTSCDYADTLRQQDNPGDRQKVIFLLEEALGIATALGMRPLKVRVLTLRERAESQPGRGAPEGSRPTYPDSLTQREVEVLRLIALGKSNREIAEELALSVRTVERHITNIYGKVNARGRADATAYALSHQLLSYE
jgi:DNA-binding CsgD family transcriptional regulator